MNAEPPVTVRVTRRFNASPERVFDAWLDVGTARRFLFATPTSEMVRAEIDARVGGSFVFVDRRNGEDVAHIGHYVEITRPRRLAFTFSVEKYSQDTNRVTIDIVPSGTGSELTLTHEKVPQEYASRTEGGWIMVLDGLAGTLG